MTAFAAAIAAKLQREDKDMSKEASTEQVQQFGSHMWSDDPFVRVMNLVGEAGNVLADIAASGHAPDENAGRVAELERELRKAEGELRDAHTERDALGVELSATQRELAEARERIEELEPFLAASPCPNPTEHEALVTAYVAREVPWSDVAAGAMTIAKDGTPWMVEQVLDADVPVAFRLRNGEKTFTKTPNDLGETVRVLVPYVTPKQAEALVRDELGGTAVSS